MGIKWSYSSASLFTLCPKKYYHLRVARGIPEPVSEQMRYGLDVHKSAEDYMREGTPLPVKYDYMQKSLDRLKQLKGTMYCESRLSLTADLTPCDFKAPDVWWRGVADLLVVNGAKARVVDYKSGRDGFPDTKQLELLSLAVFKHFPEVEVVKAGLLFIVHNTFVPAKYLREEEGSRWLKWLATVESMEQAYANDVWNAKQNFTCRGWCPVMSCIHNGRS